MGAVDGGRRTRPDSAGRPPARVRSSEDLPAPLTPTRPTTSPGAMTRSRSENRTRAPWPAARPRATRVALTGRGSQVRRTGPATDRAVRPATPAVLHYRPRRRATDRAPEEGAGGRCAR